MPRPAPQQATRVLLLLCLLAVTHGSLFPWQFEPPVSMQAALHRLFVPRQWWTSNGDVLGNILLFLPVGVLAVLTLPHGRQPGPRDHARILSWALAFAFVLQVLQIWLPRRSPSASDVVWNGAGLVLGLLVAQRFHGLPRWVAVHWNSASRSGYAMALLWLSLAWWPLLPLLARSTAKKSWQQLLHGPVWQASDLLLPCVGLAVTLALLAGSRWRVAFALGLPAAALAGKFLFVLPEAPAGQAVGWMLGLVLGVVSWSLPARARLLAVAGLLLVCFGVDGLQPFAWSAQAEAFHAVPLSAALSQQKVVHTLALGWQFFWLLGLMLAARSLSQRPLPAVAALTLLALALEMLQRWIPGQRADITVALLPALAAAVAAGLMPAASSRPSR